MMLDPDDPMGAIFCMDYFALRSQNYRWLQVSPPLPLLGLLILQHATYSHKCANSINILPEGS